MVSIEEYHAFGLSGRQIAKKLKRGHETVHRTIRQLAEGLNVRDIHLQYQANKSNCGRPKIELPASEIDYIQEKVHSGWTPDVIKGRKETSISCSMRTLYRLFQSGVFNQEYLPMKGKRKPRQSKL